MKSENSNPNLTSPDAKPSNYTTNKSVKKSPKSAQKSPNFVNTTIRERRFVVAKKNLKREKSKSLTVSCKCLINGQSEKCACAAYETLRASKEGFFRNLNFFGDCADDRDENQLREEEEINSIDRNPNLCEENFGVNKCLMKNGVE